MNYLFLFLSIFIFYSCTDKKECSYDTDCKENYLCIKNSCVIQHNSCTNDTDCKGSTDCKDGEVCGCDLGVCKSYNPCEKTPCEKNNSTCVIDLINENYYNCVCKENFHKEIDSCFLDIKTVECNKTNIPENSSAIIEDVSISWDNSNKSWNQPTDCEWKCNENFHQKDMLCISNSDFVECNSNNIPENSSAVIKDVEIFWNSDNNEWSKPIDCEWECKERYIDQGDSICRISGWSNISKGFNHMCGIKAGKLYCWGKNTYGQLGTEDYESSNTPKQVGNYKDWEQISTGLKHSCGIRAGKLYCWGDNTNGELGIGNTQSFNKPKRVGSSSLWSYISSNSHASVEVSHNCGIRGGKLYCWGNNDWGELGLGYIQNDLGLKYEVIPMQIGSSTDWSIVSSGETHTCAIKNGELYCWGENSNGELGIDSQVSKRNPQLLENSWKTIYLGWETTCGIQNDNSLYCWGSNYFQLGIGIGQFETLPTFIGDNYRQLSIEKHHLCGVKLDNSLYCWGNNNNGELGIGNTENKLTPTFVREDINTVKVGIYYTCFINLEDKLYCWGSNITGILGIGSYENKMIPTEVTVQ